MQNKAMISWGLNNDTEYKILVELDFLERKCKTKPMESPFVTTDARLAKKAMMKRPPNRPCRGPVGEMVRQTPNNNVLKLKYSQLNIMNI